jgi:hypothetical protein
MNMRFKTLARARRLETRHWQLLGSAAAGLARANALLLWGSFERAIRYGAVPLGPPKPGIDADTVVWAVRAVGRRLPLRAKCIEQGIVAQRLMRRAGIDARLHYGARPGSEGSRLSAHVWVSVGGTVVLGGEEASNFAEVAAFP